MPERQPKRKALPPRQPAAASPAAEPSRAIVVFQPLRAPESPHGGPGPTSYTVSGTLLGGATLHWSVPELVGTFSVVDLGPGAAGAGFQFVTLHGDVHQAVYAGSDSAPFSCAAWDWSLWSAWTAGPGDGSPAGPLFSQTLVRAVRPEALEPWFAPLFATALASIGAAPRSADQDQRPSRSPRRRLPSGPARRALPAGTPSH